MPSKSARSRIQTSRKWRPKLLCDHEILEESMEFVIGVEWHLILHVAVGLDAVPVSFDHGKGGATSRPACLEPMAEKPRGSDYSLS